MRAGKPLVLLIAAVAIGAALWFLVGGGAGPVVPFAPPVDSTADGSTQLSTSRAGGVDSLEVPAQVERSDVDVSSASLTGTVEEGSGTVVGRVTDSSGLPVEGARVFATKSDQYVRRNHLVDPTATPEKLESSPVAVTGRDGRFEVAAPTPRDALRLAVIGTVHAAKIVEAPATAGLVVDVGDVRVELGVSVTGRVLDLRGRAISAARVMPGRPNSLAGFWNRNQNIGARTDDDGRFRLLLSGPGEFDLVASHGDYADGSVRVAPTERGARIDGVTFALGVGASITGRVAGSPADVKLQVRALSLKKPKVDGGLEGMFASFAMADRPTFAKHVTEVEAEGRFELRGLLAGVNYRVFVVAQDNESHPVATPIDVISGTRGLEIPYGTGLTVAFRVVDARSRAARDAVSATVNVTSSKSESGLVMFYQPPDKRELTAGDDGRFVIDSVPVRDPDQRLELTIRAPGYQAYSVKDVALPLRGELDLGTLELEPAPVLRVLVSDSAGAPVDGAKVGIRVPKSERSHEHPIGAELVMPSATGSRQASWGDGGVSGKSDASGECRLTVEPGAVVRVTVDHGDYERYESGSIELAASGEVVHLAKLVVGGSLVVHVFDTNGEPVRGVDVICSAVVDDTVRTRGQRKDVATDANGDATFEHLAAGEHRVSLGSTADHVSVDIEDSRRTEITLTREIRGSVSGVVTLNGLPVEGVRVSLGSAEGVVAYAMHDDFGSGVKTDSAGRYELADLKLGVVQIAVYHPSRAMASEHEVQVSEGGCVFNIPLSVAAVRGRVVDQNGEPVVGAAVSAQRAGDSNESPYSGVVLFASEGGLVASSGGDGRAKTDANGEYRLDGVEVGRPIQVSARSDRHRDGRSEPFRVESETTVMTGVDLTLEGAGKVRVQIAEDASFGMVFARFVDPATGTKDTKNAFARDGVAELTGLRAGTWTISLMGSDAPKKTVEVIEGETATVDLRR